MGHTHMTGPDEIPGLLLKVRYCAQARCNIMGKDALKTILLNFILANTEMLNEDENNILQFYLKKGADK
jgi:hypothetical protein